MSAVQRFVTDQFDVVRQSLEKLVNNCKSLSDYVRKLLSIEQEYARGLQKLTKNAADTSTGKAVQFLGAAGAGWLYTLQLTQKVSEHRLQLGDTMEERAIRTLNRVFDGDLDKQRKQLIAEGRRYSKEMEQANQKLQRAKANYVTACS
ncbi:F-BAR domain only protein 2-like isoform X2 [Corticium candelabrum]|uniref:F-BAR domain only protein 2-like isoform X2 n=1 Tax=Corticium candelabrum TaxID=121492 RepID=UPI002E2564A4|nr:F-BAR domain only protein 2-like isoform X2 [Corticium candelabrum]